MIDTTLFAAADWVSTWLTPIWILSVGVAVGLALVALILGVFVGLSRLPVIGTLAENHGTRNLTALIIGGALFLLSLPLILLPAFGEWSRQGLSETLINAPLATAIVLLLSFGIGLAVVALAWRRTVNELALAIREGILLWVLVITLSLASFSFLGLLVVEKPGEILASLPRLMQTGTEERTFRVPGSPSGQAADGVIERRFDLSFRMAELRQIVFDSDQLLDLSFQPLSELTVGQGSIVELEPGKTLILRKHDYAAQGALTGDADALYVRYHGSADATLSVTVVTAPEYSEVTTIPIAAVSVVLLFLLYLLQRSLMPKLSAVALATFKSEIAQPVFIILLIAGAVILIFAHFMPYSTFGEDIKMLKESGRMIILVFSIFVAVWAASKSIAEEIEGRTALTVLSKPIGRREFILGKFVGIAWTVALMFIALGTLFLILVAYKPIYDGRETGVAEITWQLCYSEMVLLVPALALAFLETLVMAAISVAISTRLPWLANLLICFAIYALGHLTPLLVQSSITGFEPVVFVARLIATLFPVLDYYQVEAAVMGGSDVPLLYLGWVLVYSIIYGAIAMLLALVLFEDRDLA